MTEAIFILNAGSSSIKFAVFSRTGEKLKQMLSGKIEGIGTAPHLVAKDTNGKVLTEHRWKSGAALGHEDFLGRLLDWMDDHLGDGQLIGVGHRVVHGGGHFFAPVRVTPSLIAALKALIPLAPQHQPHNLAAIEAVAAMRPHLAQVACFDIDPGVLLYLFQHKGIAAAELSHLLYDQSGLLGVSGISSDMRALLDNNDCSADEAVELFVYRIAREAGALVSSLGGLNGFVFTAGIGENSAEIRQQVCDRLAWLGVILDVEANECHAAVISAPDSRITVRVTPTEEERMIALHTQEMLERWRSLSACCSMILARRKERCAPSASMCLSL